jgi:hypothetical protein
VSSTATHWTELARRSGNGLDAALLWSESDKRVKVCVSDARVCHHLDFEVSSARALAAFSTPFADAATRLPQASEATPTHEGVKSCPTPSKTSGSEKRPLPRRGQCTSASRPERSHVG